MIYLDNNATTRIYDEALHEIDRVSQWVFANPGSSHVAGDAAKAELDKARQTLAVLLGTFSHELIFTGCGSESNNLAIKGLAEMQYGKDHVISTLIEHSSVDNVLKYLETKGYRITWLKPNQDGLIAPADVEKAITDKTFLISVIHANNEIGTVQDMRAIGTIARQHKIIFHADGVQAFGKIPVDLMGCNISLYSLSAHKIHGPKGCGLLYKRDGVELSPLIHGGGQENNLRSGTENVPLIAAFAKAAEIKTKKLAKDAEYLRQLTEYFWDKVKTAVPTAERNGSVVNRLTNTINIRFPGVSGPKIIAYLSDSGIYATPSSACSSRSDKPSRILTAIGLMADEAFSSIRFSFDVDNTVDQADFVAEKLAEINKKLL
jgi:cysteine desulfurase